MRLLVTGGAGFIGCNFVRYILDRYPDYHVLNLDKLTYAGNLENLEGLERNERYRFVQGDICDPAVVAEALNTGADAIIGLAGGENAAGSVEGFKPLSDEAALSMAPDIIVTMPAHTGDRRAEIAAMPGLSATPAAKSGRILELGGSYILQFGPRAAGAARELMQAFQKTGTTAN